MDPKDTDSSKIDVQDPQEARICAVRSQVAEFAEHTIALARERDGSFDV